MMKAVCLGLFVLLVILGLALTSRTKQFAEIAANYQQVCNENDELRAERDQLLKQVMAADKTNCQQPMEAVRQELAAKEKLLQALKTILTKTRDQLSAAQQGLDGVVKIH